ncbi:DUF4190 domain-containing protein [Kineosporia sp. A_224]|uniref:DUF4190 domain-containing protein n=1 Tax=Kineosporia sp. A_224 TaxID=1962180 RepID=UPI000B4BD30A|nr:DUF4190 domain-containing protein [Kineosporia sp. A_224]
MTMPPYGQQRPGPPAHYYPVVAVVPTSGQATASMICGIGSFFSCGLLGIVAVILGHVAIRETGTGAKAGHGMAVTGLILGYVTVLPWAAFWVMVLAGAVATPFVGSTTSP